GALVPVEVVVPFVAETDVDAEIGIEEAACGYEEPIVSIKLFGPEVEAHAELEPILLRRQRRPAHMPVAPAPGHPGRGPVAAGHPAPAEPIVVVPAAVVIDGPGIGL